MTSKILRSFILENFPLELRVEMDLLSKQRGVQNDPQQAELLRLFRKYNIDMVPLGMGTNRFGFKMGPYAIKFATNADGIIDNFKEFKMSQRLQPHVVMTFEVSQNGTILVTEYIQPFGSFREMKVYEEQILSILEELSSVYLIGDIGLSANNYGNWGIRIGTTKPVCLDFAYVYYVKSRIFLCRKTECRTKGSSMMIPSKDYSHLVCPKCGTTSTFEKLRLRLGKTEHLEEIGDLTEEGYLLYESKINTILDVNRSPYLKKFIRDEEPVEEIVEERMVDTFIDPKALLNKMRE